LVQPGSDVSGGAFTRVVDGGLVEGAEDGQAVMSGSVGGGAGTSSVEEAVVLVGLGSGQVSVVELTFEVTEVNHVEVTTNLTNKVVTSDFNGGGASLLVNPLNNGISSATTSVVFSFAIVEPVEGGETLDLVALGESIVLGGVNLGQVLGIFLVSEDSSCGSVFRGQLFAVSAPGCVEFNQQVFVF
jgi:hypothetical protein